MGIELMGGVGGQGGAGFNGNAGGSGGGSGFAGMGGGFDWVSFAQKLGDINQTAYKQEANTSFSAVADPAGFNLQNIQKTVRFVNARKQQKIDNDLKRANTNVQNQTAIGLSLQNKKEKRQQEWGINLRRLLKGGR